ncbi:MAG: hypothetical protein RBU45_08765 [Myxococcota bacterium]|jgi:hypothetical protein|nr:hypothetical protein [Myxococcota bacterium]
MSWVDKLKGAASWVAENPETVAQFAKGVQGLRVDHVVVVPESAIDDRARDLTLGLAGYRLVDLACCCMASGKMIIIGELELEGAPVRALMEVRPKGTGISWQPGDRRVIVEVDGPEIQAKSLSGIAMQKAGEGLLELVLPGLLASCAKYAIGRVFESLSRQYIESAVSEEAPLLLRHEEGNSYSIDLMKVGLISDLLGLPFKVPCLDTEVRLEDFLVIEEIRFVRRGAAFSIDLRDDHPAIRGGKALLALAPGGKGEA